jgi:L-amino acid N-acyltransferase YncA
VVRTFNHFVETGFAACPTERVTGEFFDRVLAMTQEFPAVSIRAESGEVVGFAFLRPYHAAATFRRTAEITYFVLLEHTGSAVGRWILSHFVEAARTLGVDNLLPSVSSLNQQSLRFYERAGFERCGVFRALGRKFGRDFDVVWFQKRI